MSLSITRTYSANNVLTEAQLDAAFDSIETKFNSTLISGSEIANTTIEAANLASNAVTTAKILDSNVTTDKIADANVTMAKIAAVDRIPARNYIINGAFDFWQRGTSFAAAATGTYSADRFQYVKATTGAAHTLSRETSILPTLSESGFQSSYALKVDCTTADAAVAAGDLVAIRYGMEGYDYAQIKGREVTLTFWVYATKTGVHCVSFRNSGSDRSYVAEYTISSTNTWEKKTITLTLNPSGGTDDFTNGMGLAISWCLMGGSTYQTTAGSWQTGNFLATSSQVNACDDTANNFYLAQVMLNVGAVAAPMTRAGHTISDEVSLCQRYYEKSYNVTVAPATVTSVGVVRLKIVTSAATPHTIFFKTRKRTTPSAVTFYSPGDGATANWYDETSSLNRGVTADNTSESSVVAIATATNAYVANSGDTVQGHWAVEADFA